MSDINSTIDKVAKFFVKKIDNFGKKYYYPPVADGTLPDWLDKKPEPEKLVEKKPENNINYYKKTGIQINNVENNIYSVSKTLFLEINIDQTSLPSLPPSNIASPSEELDQTPTDITIGKPITLAQSIKSQNFGQLIHNPFVDKKPKIIQTKISGYQNKIEKIHKKATEKFAKYLAGSDETNMLDSIALIVPESWRGFSGEVGLIFGAETIKAFNNYGVAKSNNAFVGVSDLIPLEYEIITNKLDLDDISDNLDEVCLLSSDLTIENLANNYLTEITGEIEIGKCIEPGEESKGYSEYKKDSEKSILYQGTGLEAINNLLVGLENKLTAIHKDVCMAIDPPIDIPALLPGECLHPETKEGEEKKKPNKESDIKVSGIVGDFAEEQINNFKDTLKNTALGWLLLQAGKVGGWKGVAASWFISYVAESIFNQQEKVSQVLCETSHTLEELKELISEIETVSAVPDWYQTRIGAERPSLVLIYNEPDTNSFWSLTIPHYSGGEKKVEGLASLSYTKGNFMTIYVLNDNSKIIVNTKTKKEGEKLIKSILSKNIINKNYLKNADLKSGGERKGKKLKEAKVVPYAAKWYPNGIKDNKPEWTYRFKDEE